MTNEIYRGFLMGGFECSSHRDRRNRRLDLIASTQHDRFAEADYRRLLSLGMLTARDGVRWHHIEKSKGVYDFESLASQAEAAHATGIEIIWDLFHYGYPDHIDIFSPVFPDVFARFARETVQFLYDKLGPGNHICPINEISFFSWNAGRVGEFFPAKTKKAAHLKRQLINASIAAICEIKRVDPTARIMLSDPAINVIAAERSPRNLAAAVKYHRSQFEAFDGIVTETSLVDVIGINFYPHNQWLHPDRRTVMRGHTDYRPFREIIAEYYERYNKPILIAETGIEDDGRPAWFRYICDEVRAAMKSGIPVLGICLYPIVNHPGWADDRHCHNGLWDYADINGNREVYTPLATEIVKQQKLFRSMLGR